ncbi:MAG: 1-acyl-sn-glycerol-3-phosphate acyltransferase [Prevotella sp.]|nr:1-acyl-sn-glycerol-3-phosphate acyltransferase [Prevotella sp.]
MEASNHNSPFSTLNPQLADFHEIRPYEAGEMKQAFDELLADRQFSLVMKGLAPWLPKTARNGLLRLAFTGVKTPLDFQKRFMKPVVKHIIRRHTDGCTFDDSALRPSPSTIDPSPRYTFVSNHRDIVLDSAFLDVMLVDKGYPTTVEIGIGDNLLIYPWIKRLVRMNKAFTVRRGLTPHEMLRSSQLMSRYIHYAVTQKQENIWIAQREGRAKDSDDRTQESVLKMLAMGAADDVKSPADRLRPLNIVPLTISYEYDPCDYLKAQEMQQKRDNPAFKKSRQDDLDNMKTGIFGYKGRVHYCCSRPLNTWIDTIAQLPKQEFYAALAKGIDRDIHRGYRLFPGNYVALDETLETPLYADRYTAEEADTFHRYIDGQLAKVTLAHPDRDFLRHQMLLMYANPLRNFLKVKK